MSTASPSRAPLVVALSGGVDSAVAAHLLREAGEKVLGVYMENWTKSELTPHCTTETDRRDALRVAHHLTIPFQSVSFEKEYRARVVEYFYREYAAGRTPNPDVACNREVKFGALLDWALEHGASGVATGHYARVDSSSGNSRLLKAVDGNKDQSYFLHELSEEQLSHARFPIGGMTKPEVRALAQHIGLPVAEKPDSQGICFVGQVDVRQLLKERIATQHGPIVTAAGETVGEHEGLAFYTIGQRQGLGMGGGIPYYVAAKRMETNTLVVAHGNQDPALYSKELVASSVHWINGTPSFPLNCMASIRYRQAPQECVVIPHERGALVRFSEPQRAVTPGQSVVFYEGDVCLGGAVIKEAA